MACDSCDENSIELPIGPQGDTGANGNYVTVSTEAAGVNCPNGGLKIEVKDGTSNVTLSTKYVCNGINGAAGTNGVDGTNSIGQTYTASTTGQSIFSTYGTISRADGPILTLPLTAAGTYLFTVDIDCRQGPESNYALYNDFSQPFGYGNFQYQLNGTTTDPYNATNISTALTNSQLYPYLPVLAGAVNSPYYKLIQNPKQTVSKSFFLTIAGAEDISLYAWYTSLGLATVDKPATLYTFKATINALKVV